MKTSDFNYELPEELIAQTPAQPRDSSRLLVYHRGTGEIEHRIFRDIIEYLLETYGEREMLRLLFENPDRMIYDRDIPHHGSLPERRRGLFF